MPRAKKDGKFVNVYMDKSLADAIDQYATETGVPKTTVIEKAVEKYLEDQEIVNGTIDPGSFVQERKRGNT